MGAAKGNKNAKRGNHSGVVIRLNVASTDLLYEFFCLEGNSKPDREDFQNAVYYALKQVYGRKLEDETIII